MPQANHTDTSTDLSSEWSSILLVDDTPENLRLLSDLLKTRNYRTYAVTNGQLALQSALHTQPDLILLDVNMPIMDGYETCQHLKDDPRLRDIPVIFLSAMSESLDKVRAFEVGAVDYITKPFQIQEVEARVQTHLESARMKRALKSQNERLEAMVSRRTQQLVDANRRISALDKAKSDFLNMISHELRTPLSGLLLIGEVLFEECKASEKVSEIRSIFEESRHRVVSLINDALLLTRIQVQGEQYYGNSCLLDEVVKKSIAAASPLAKLHNVEFSMDQLPDTRILGDAELMQRATQSLLETAVKFAKQPVHIYSLPDQGKMHLLIDAQGRNIPKASLDKFFDMLSIGESINEGGDIGLAPVVAARILPLFEGSVSLENIPGPGIRLHVWFQELANVQNKQD
ncbi:MAG TPA: response regulator [Fibrobacteraceae bacterium]|nr:response regulator [Fibrobacteraceae bacterium]